MGTRRARSPEPADDDEARRRRARTLRFATPTATDASAPDDDADAEENADAGGGGDVMWPVLRRQLQLRGGAPRRSGEAGGSMDSGPVEQDVDGGELAGLLDELNAAVDAGASEMERARLANAIAQRVAVRRPLAATRKAVIAASQWIRAPERYGSAEACHPSSYTRARACPADRADLLSTLGGRNM